MYLGSGTEYLIEVEQEIYDQFKERLVFFLGHKWAIKGYSWIFPMENRILKVGAGKTHLKSKDQDQTDKTTTSLSLPPFHGYTLCASFIRIKAQFFSFTKLFFSFFCFPYSYRQELIPGGITPLTSIFRFPRFGIVSRSFSRSTSGFFLAFPFTSRVSLQHPGFGINSVFLHPGLFSL